MAVISSGVRRSVDLAVFVIVLIVIWGKYGLVSGQCQGNLPALMAQCPKYVQKSGPRIPPSKECCDVVRTADVPCVCKYITSEVEQIVSMEKVVYVASFCGKPLAHGTKCGSYTVP